MLFQTQAYIIFSQKALKLWDFFFFLIGESKF